MNSEFESYGAFKSASALHPGRISSWIERVLFLKNRYLRFFRLAQKSEPLVELGCGSGKFLSVLQSAGFADLAGVEPSPSYVDQPSGLSIHRCTAQQYLTATPSRTIGTFVALDVFEHIPAMELRNLLSVMYDRLQPGGIVIFRVPNMSSPFALTNYFGDLTHKTPLNEVSIRQLIFGTEFFVEGMYDEPVARPRSTRMIFGVVLWPIYKQILLTLLSAFNLQSRIVTPNLVCILKKPS